MALQKMSEILNKAEQNSYAIGYFEAWDMYSFEAVLEAAEQENAPVILGFGGTMMQQQWLGRFSVAPFGAYGRVIAENANVPVAFILNEVLELDHIAEGVKAGYNTVMLDSCHLPFEENAAITKKVVELARPHGIEVQAEFGRLPNFGEDAAGTLTDPDRALDFVEATGVDFLAVSIGNVHLQTKGSSSIDTERLSQIRQKVSVPLVIHGGTGFPDEKVKEVIKIGVSLFHYGTSMKKAFLEETTKVLSSSLDTANPDYQTLVGSRKQTDILLPAKEKIKDIVKGRIKLYGCSGKA